MPIMKKVEAVQNFLNVLNDYNFVDLYEVKNKKTNVSVSICFLTKEEAEAHLDYLLKYELKGEFYIGETCVYFGRNEKK